MCMDARRAKLVSKNMQLLDRWCHWHYGACFLLILWAENDEMKHLKSGCSVEKWKSAKLKTEIPWHLPQYCFCFMRLLFMCSHFYWCWRQLCFSSRPLVPKYMGWHDMPLVVRYYCRSCQWIWKIISPSGRVCVYTHVHTCVRGVCVCVCVCMCVSTSVCVCVCVSDRCMMCGKPCKICVVTRFLGDAHNRGPALLSSKS